MHKKILLVILDGWGITENQGASAIDRARTPFIDSLYAKYPNSQLLASGAAVGLPPGQMGNSEVGHLNIGAGRTVYQNLVRINKAVQTKEFDHNKVLSAAFAYAERATKNMHLMGLVSDGGIHSHIDHLKALLSLAHRRGAHRVFVHAFTDGRDADPYSGVHFIRQLQAYMDTSTGQLATVAGRYFAMDRDHRWERIKRAYDALTQGVGEHTRDISETLEKNYALGTSDEFIPPIVAVDQYQQPLATMLPGDVVLFFNFRSDRARQLTTALTQRNFSEHAMHAMPLHYITMTRYDDTFEKVGIVFDHEPISGTLGEVLSKSGKTQIRIAETEKYPHVTFFFSGGREEPYPGEQRILCPSPKVPTYDLCPEMSAHEIVKKILPELRKKHADFICLNFANPDMVGHTGVFSAGVAACETVDVCTKSVTEEALKSGYTTLIIADHGNAETMLNANRLPSTVHTTNPVPCILVSDDYRGVLREGTLADVAPTVLTLMGIPVPLEMTGHPLIDA